MKLLLAARSLLFYTGFVLLVILGSTLICLCFFLPFNSKQTIASTSNRLVMYWLRITCGIRIEIIGRENIPAEPVVVLSNHQSSWETFYLLYLFSPVSIILKRSLLFIPFFGWALYFMRPIAIERSQPSGAIRQVLKLGKQRLGEGNNIVIFPEGTRAKTGQKLPFKSSGAALAKAGRVPVLPVRHDAGTCWPVHTLLKYPGTIKLEVGSPLDSSELDVRELTAQAEAWINSDNR